MGPLDNKVETEDPSWLIKDLYLKEYSVTDDYYSITESRSFSDTKKQNIALCKEHRQLSSNEDIKRIQESFKKTP